MSITTTQRTRRLGLASSTAATAALLLLASACGTENAVSQAPGSISGPKAASPEVTQPLYLAPSGRPVPLPGQGG